MLLSTRWKPIVYTMRKLNRLIRISTTALALLIAASAASADTFTVSFTASGFVPTTAPQDPVSGSFTFEAASVTSAITAVDSVNLTIFGHTYTLAEVGGLTNTGGVSLIGANAGGGPAILTGGDNDFLLAWVEATAASPSFDYSFAGANTIYFANTTTFAITPVEANVPEPSSIVLFLTIAAGLTLSLRRLRTRPRVG